MYFIIQFVLIKVLSFPNNITNLKLSKIELNRTEMISFLARIDSKQGVNILSAISQFDLHNLNLSAVY